VATDAEYKIATQAALPIAQADLDQMVPFFFRSDIDPAQVAKIVGDLTKAGLDAVDAARAKRQQEN
jgi:hypothetical protein